METQILKQEWKASEIISIWRHANDHFLFSSQFKYYKQNWLKQTIWHYFIGLVIYKNIIYNNHKGSNLGFVNTKGSVATIQLSHCSTKAATDNT